MFFIQSSDTGIQEKQRNHKGQTWLCYFMQLTEDNAFVPQAFFFFFFFHRIPHAHTFQQSKWERARVLWWSLSPHQGKTTTVSYVNCTIPRVGSSSCPSTWYIDFHNQLVPESGLPMCKALLNFCWNPWNLCMLRISMKQTQASIFTDGS